MSQTNGTYTAEELTDKAGLLFGKPPEVVATALKMAAKQTATLEDAKDIVKNFLAKEVK